MWLEATLSQAMKCLVVLLFVCSYGASANENLAPVQSGEIDVAATLNTNQSVSLKGEWHYKWGLLLAPEDAAEEADDLSFMPNTWKSSHQEPAARSGLGIATYRVQLNNITQGVQWGLLIPEISTAFALYLDNQLVASGGRVSTNERDVIPYSGLQLVHLGSLSESVSLTLQVSNFHHSRGGPKKPLVFGDFHKLQQNNIIVLFEQSLIVAVAAIVSLFLFIHWFIDRNEIPTLLLACATLVISARIGIFDSQPLYLPFGPLPWWLHKRMEYSIDLIGPAIIITWLYCVYPQDFNKKIVSTLSLASIAGCALISFTTTIVFTKAQPFFLALLACILIYAFLGVFRVLWSRREGGLSIALGASILIICCGLEILAYLRVIPESHQYMLYGMFAFLLSLMINLVYLRSTEKKHIALLSEQLLEINHSLEQRVAKRTQDLAEKADALKNANNSLKILANTDSLTQLLNRREFIEQCLEISTRQPLVTMVLIDVDHFKAVNDNFGHAAGDEVLIRLSRLIDQITRPVDRSGRFGGEEFVLLLHDVNASNAEVICSRLVSSVTTIDCSDLSSELHLSISAGAVTAKLRKDNIDELLRIADDAMYSVKNGGRNGFKVVACNV